MEIALTERHHEPLMEAVARGEVDAAVVGIHGPPLPAQIHTRLIATEPLVLAVHRGHPLARGTTVTFDQLKDQPMITLVRGSGLRAVLDDACGEAGFTPRITAAASGLGSLVELASGGLGVTVLPRSATRNADLAVLKIIRPRLQRRTALAWKHTATTPARARIPCPRHQVLLRRHTYWTEQDEELLTG